MITDQQIRYCLAKSKLGIFSEPKESNFSIPKYNQILASVLLVNVKLRYSSKQHIIYMNFKLKNCKNAKQNLSELYFTWFRDSQI